MTDIDRQTSADKSLAVTNDRTGRGQQAEALAKPIAKASPKSGQVLKSVSSAHSDALKQLKDR